MWCQPQLCVFPFGLRSLFYWSWISKPSSFSGWSDRNLNELWESQLLHCVDEVSFDCQQQPSVAHCLWASCKQASTEMLFYKGTVGELGLRPAGENFWNPLLPVKLGICSCVPILTSDTKAVARVLPWELVGDPRENKHTWYKRRGRHGRVWDSSRPSAHLSKCTPGSPA